MFDRRICSAEAPMRNLRASVGPAAMVVVVLVLSGCGAAGGGGGGVAGAEYRVSDCEPGIPSKLLMVGVLHPPLTFNPALATDRVSSVIASQFTSTLYRFNPSTSAFEPFLSTGYDRDPDGRTFVVHLRRNITFSDGTAFDADDVLATIKYILNPKVRSRNAVYLRDGKDQVEFSKVDGATLLCRAPKGFYAIEAVLAKIPVLSEAAILDAEGKGRVDRLYSTNTPPAEIASIGPFKLRAFAPDEKKVVLERNPLYWEVDRAGRTLPYLDEVVFSFTGTTAEMSLRFRRGETDIIDNIDPADAERLKGISGLQLTDTGPSCVTYVGWFNQNLRPAAGGGASESGIAPFRSNWYANERFRQAASRSIDRPSVASKVFGGKGSPAAGLLSPQWGPWAFPPVPEVTAPAAVRQSLLECGFSASGAWLRDADKNNIEFTISTLSGDLFSESIGRQLETCFEAVGIKATTVPVMYDLFYRKIYSSFDYDFALMPVDGPAHPYFFKELASPGDGRLWSAGTDGPLSVADGEILSALNGMFTSEDYAAKHVACRKVQEIVGMRQFVTPIVRPNGLFAAKGKLRNVNVGFQSATALWNIAEIFYLED